MFASIAVHVAVHERLALVDVWALRNTCRALNASFAEHYDFDRDSAANFFERLDANVAAALTCLVREHGATLTGSSILRCCYATPTWQAADVDVLLEDDACIERWRERFGLTALAPSNDDYHQSLPLIFNRREFLSDSRTKFDIIVVDSAREHLRRFDIGVCRATLRWRNNRFELRVANTLDTVERRIVVNRTRFEAIASAIEITLATLGITIERIVKYVRRGFVISASHWREVCVARRSQEVAYDHLYTLRRWHDGHALQLYHPRYVDAQCWRCVDVCRATRTMPSVVEAAERAMSDGARMMLVKR